MTGEQLTPVVRGTIAPALVPFFLPAGDDDRSLARDLHVE
jgi:hypothetical protein